MWNSCGCLSNIYDAMNAHDCIYILECRNLCLCSSWSRPKGLIAISRDVKTGFSPYEITIVFILRACTYSGLLEDGIRLFKIIEPKYGIKPLITMLICFVFWAGLTIYHKPWILSTQVPFQRQLCFSQCM